MGIFKSKNEKRLDEIILRMEMNMSNNYKDNAQSNFKELEEQLENLKADGSLKKKVLEKYEKTLFGQHPLDYCTPCSPLPHPLHLL